VSRLSLEELLLGNLAQLFWKEEILIYMKREEAYEALKRATQQDFGYNVEAWKTYLKDNPIDRKRFVQSQLPEPNWKRHLQRKKKQ
jgi:hypothetical protein